jgi:Mor family transcriptional regulator
MIRQTDRNRVIFDAFEAGRTTEQIAEDHALTWNRVRAILTDEKHRRTVSPEPFYRALRSSRQSLYQRG